VLLESFFLELCQMGERGFSHGFSTNQYEHRSLCQSLVFVVTAIASPSPATFLSPCLVARQKPSSMVAYFLTFESRSFGIELGPFSLFYFIVWENYNYLPLNFKLNCNVQKLKYLQLTP
jgi:hypothetical protein